MRKSRYCLRFMVFQRIRASLRARAEERAAKVAAEVERQEGLRAIIRGSEYSDAAKIAAIRQVTGDSVLREAIRADGSREVRTAAITTLGDRFATRENLEFLRGITLVHEDPRIRGAAWEAASRTDAALARRRSSAIL
jgi:hypothetical protein